MAAKVVLPRPVRQMSFRASLKRTLYTRPGWTSGTIVAIDAPYRSRIADGSASASASWQQWPACLRSINVTGPPNLDELVTVRGVPAIFSGGYSQLGLTIGTTTVFLGGQGRAFLLEAARSLRGVNNAIASTGKLPKPAPGALDETLEC